MILEKINKPNDIHEIPLSDFPLLAKEIREFLIEHVSRTGGHLASNLGVIEMTLALHNVLDLTRDKLIWDVGHQAYTHKLLTGRRDAFDTLRKENGLSGFPKRSESETDAFDSGHSSNSISAGLGYVCARDLLGQDHHVVSVIGDGALTGGLAYEALNNAAELKTNFIIILNDNEMSIAPNIGGVSTYLSAVRTMEGYTGMKLAITRTLNKIPSVGPRIVGTVRRTKSSIKHLFIPGMLFEDMGLTYLGPVDGYHLRQMMRLFNEAKKVQGPVIVHVHTKKGYGYGPAEENPEQFHGTGPFDIKTGKPLYPKTAPTYTDVFASTLCRLGEKEPRLVAITAAMPEGTGLVSFKERFPDRFFDVGIAEGHGVSFAAGLALGGLLPVAAVYSSFLQRGIDQLVHDICMQHLHVIFAIDRAGFVGADGETHHGVLDLSYLGMIPGMTKMAPASAKELELMLEAAVAFEGPVAIRYSKETAASGLKGEDTPVISGKGVQLVSGRKIAFIGVGTMVENCLEAAGILEEDGYSPSVVNIRFVKPIDEGLLRELAASHDCFVIAEENVGRGGCGQEICEYLSENHPGSRIKCLAVPDTFVTAASVMAQRKKSGLDAESISRAARELLEEA